MNNRRNQGLGKAITAVAVIGGVVVGGLAGALIGASTVEPEVVTETVTITVPGETITETVEVEVPVNVTVVETVEVEDESFKLLTCDRLGYDIISECVEEVEAEDVALNIAFAELEDNFAEELEDADIVDDEDDITLVNIYTDFEDIEVTKSNFDRDKYVFEIEVKYDDDEADKKSTSTFTVKVEDGEGEIINIE